MNRYLSAAFLVLALFASACGRSQEEVESDLRIAVERHHIKAMAADDARGLFRMQAVYRPDILAYFQSHRQKTMTSSLAEEARAYWIARDPITVHVQESTLVGASKDDGYFDLTAIVKDKAQANLLRDAFLDRSKVCEANKDGSLDCFTSWKPWEDDVKEMALAAEKPAARDADAPGGLPWFECLRVTHPEPYRPERYTGLYIFEIAYCGDDILKNANLDAPGFYTLEGPFEPIKMAVSYARSSHGRAAILTMIVDGKSAAHAVYRAFWNIRESGFDCGYNKCWFAGFAIEYWSRFKSEGIAGTDRVGPRTPTITPEFSEWHENGVPRVWGSRESDFETQPPSP